MQSASAESVLCCIDRHGFWGIFLLAAWPNALFDLCGICCGHFLMPFWVFFGATFCGKALAKVLVSFQLLMITLSAHASWASVRCQLQGMWHQ